MVDIAVVYRSVTGCSHTFVSTYFSSNTIYPSSFMHHCPQCGKHHLFRPQDSYIVSTPLKKAMFEESCREKRILETNVDVSIKKK
jgi:predicted RNA-binding Zn-ribbon protein involved in translation (DUF1610 family)